MAKRDEAEAQAPVSIQEGTADGPEAAEATDTATGGYEIGYGKPPLHTRFQRGPGGNRKGRRRGSKNTRTLFAEALEQRIQVRVGDRFRSLTKREVIVRRHVDALLQQPNIRLLQLLLKLEEASDAAPIDKGPHLPDADPDDESMLAFLAEVLTKKGQPS